MTQYGLLIDNEYCTGCHSCEIACQNEHGLPGDQWGIKVLELGPIKLLEDKQWEWRYIPALTKYCDLCKERVDNGEVPSCQLHCLAQAIEYGSVEDLAKKMEAKGKMASIFIP